MAKQCPNCGLKAEDAEKFCPACGEPLTGGAPDEADSAPQGEETPENGEPRIFFLRRKKYGDTEQFDDPGELDGDDTAHGPSSLKTDLSLYISIFAAVLAIAAIVLVVIFAIIPAQQGSKDSDASPSEAATAAPTQAPTEPPIAGEYSLSSVTGERVGFLSYLYRDCYLVMSADYTGSLRFGSGTISDVKLDKDSDKAEFLDADGTYSFDGTVLTIEYRGVTLVFKKK